MSCREGGLYGIMQAGLIAFGRDNVVGLPTRYHMPCRPDQQEFRGELSVVSGLSFGTGACSAPLVLCDELLIVCPRTADGLPPPSLAIAPFTA